MKPRILIDTGPIVALFRPRDAYHVACRQQAMKLPSVACTCWPVVTEAAHLLNRDPRIVRLLVAACDSSKFELLSLGVADLSGIHSILSRYHDQGFDLADAALMWLAEREEIDTVFTLDRRHFSVFRTSGGKALNLLPDEHELQRA